jgi:hypothetical protein
MVDFNFSEKAPRAHFKWRKLGKDRDETIRAVLQAAIQANQVKPDVDELGLALGMTMHEVSQITRTLSQTGSTPGETDGEGNDVGGGESHSETIVEKGLREAGGTSVSTADVLASRGVVDDIVSRIAGQARNAEKKGSLADLEASLGYRKKMELALQHDRELTQFDAFRAAEEIYSRTNSWMTEAKGHFDSADEFSSGLQRVLLEQVDDQLGS